jgi:DNA polymerase III delta prime subunit
LQVPYIRAMKFDFKKGDEMTENKEMTIAELRQSAMDALILFKDGKIKKSQLNAITDHLKADMKAMKAELKAAQAVRDEIKATKHAIAQRKLLGKESE